MQKPIQSLTHSMFGQCFFGQNFFRFLFKHSHVQADQNNDSKMMEWNFDKWKHYVEMANSL